MPDVTDRTRVLVVDDHPVFRDGLRQLLADDFEVVTEASDGLEALAVVAHHAVDVIVMDLHMPHLDGADAIARLRAAAPSAQVVVLSTYHTDAEITSAVEAGAAGYILKDAPRAELLAAVRAAARGESVLSPAVASRVLNRLRTAETLAPREIELLTLVARGATNREAAATLMVSEATVKAWLLRIYERLGARDRASAVAEAYRRGLLR